jgi:hypothetical protein
MDVHTFVPSMHIVHDALQELFHSECRFRGSPPGPGHHERVDRLQVVFGEASCGIYLLIEKVVRGVFQPLFIASKGLLLLLLLRRLSIAIGI